MTGVTDLGRLGTRNEVDPTAFLTFAGRSERGWSRTHYLEYLITELERSRGWALRMLMPDRHQDGSVMVNKPVSTLIPLKSGLCGGKAER